MRKSVLILLSFLTCLFLLPFPGLAETSPDTYPTRLAGADRYHTAIQISQAGWATSANVVLARGDDFPDALAGAVLAQKMQAPLLLTDPGALRPEVQAEIQRLGTGKAYLLGGPAALSANIANKLASLGITSQRLQGTDRYGTAASIARLTNAPGAEAFLVTGYKFADALSISSYAAAHNLPILMTDPDSLPEATEEILTELHIKKITIIGGTGVVGSAVENTLKGRGYETRRIAGSDRYQTNLRVIQTLDFTRTGMFIATGENYPDALAGAVLAARQNQPLLLIKDKIIPEQTFAYLNSLRPQIAQFNVLGGYGLIPYGTESIIRTGSLQPRISLQYWDSNNLAGYQSQLNFFPANASQFMDFISPNWYKLNDIPAGQTAADGSFSGANNLSPSDYRQLVQAAQARGLKVLPIIASGWSIENQAALDSLLASKTARSNLSSRLLAMLQETGSDGIVVDFELLSDSSGPYLTQFVKELGPQLKAQNKLLVMAVMPRTVAGDRYQEFNYPQLARNVDYLNIMTYNYSTSVPGPIAPLGWVKEVLDFSKGQGLAMDKVLLGIPYYGRDWTRTAEGYTSAALGLSNALQKATSYKAAVRRLTESADPVGIPYFTYTDTAKAEHTVYYEDPQSWEAKLSLVDKYGLGGIGSWSLKWLDQEASEQLFPLLQQHLR
jgi:spore germination protein YaaH/putative cell wall-binding protein